MPKTVSRSLGAGTSKSASIQNLTGGEEKLRPFLYSDRPVEGCRIVDTTWLIIVNGDGLLGGNTFERGVVAESSLWLDFWKKRGTRHLDPGKRPCRLGCRPDIA